MLCLWLVLNGKRPECVIKECVSRYSRLYIFQEMEQIEEHYKDETRDLLSTVKRLQDENRKLSSSLVAAAEQQRDSAFSEDSGK